MTQENKDAQYREEARIALREARDGLSIEDAYLAGRKKGDEELFNCKLSNKAMTMTMEQDEKEIESLKKELEETKWCRDVELSRANNLLTENKELKKEIESKAAQIKILREALEKLEKYIANNGDCWVQNVARQTLAEIDKMKGV